MLMRLYVEKKVKLVKNKKSVFDLFKIIGKERKNWFLRLIEKWKEQEDIYVFVLK